MIVVDESVSSTAFCCLKIPELHFTIPFHVDDSRSIHLDLWICMVHSQGNDIIVGYRCFVQSEIKDIDE